MTHRCYQVEELSELLDLEESDPRRRHLDECPRCRALLAEYRNFLLPPAEVPGADLEDAGIRLKEALEREVLDGKPASLLKRIVDARSFRTILAVAATICVLLAAYSFLEDRPPESEGIVLREDPVSGQEGGIELLPVEPVPDGAVRLAWRSVDGAGAFRIHIYSAELDEVAVLGPLTDISFLLRPSEIPGLPASGTIMLWRVMALSEGDVIAYSPLGTFRVP